ncbi:MAG: hypothetical protein HY318_00100 [Armatimonadetes bacterium]|nr:hypothetical protein [Armatimonadota bacterium]
MKRLILSTAMSLQANIVRADLTLANNGVSQYEIVVCDGPATCAACAEPFSPTVDLSAQPGWFGQLILKWTVDSARPGSVAPNV